MDVEALMLSHSAHPISHALPPLASSATAGRCSPGRWRRRRGGRVCVTGRYYAPLCEADGVDRDGDGVADVPIGCGGEFFRRVVVFVPGVAALVALAALAALHLTSLGRLRVQD
jgi:hypothetical protein